MLEKIEKFIGFKINWNLSMVSGYILTRKKSETVRNKWRCVEKQTLSKIFSKREALEIIATQSYSGKEIKIDFEIVKIEKGSVRHCSSMTDFSN